MDGCFRRVGTAEAEKECRIAVGLVLRLIFAAVNGEMGAATGELLADGCVVEDGCGVCAGSRVSRRPVMSPFEPMTVGRTSVVTVGLSCGKQCYGACCLLPMHQARHQAQVKARYGRF